MSEAPLAEQIDAVTRLLDDLRWARNEPGCIEYRTFEALKTIAKDLRARQPQVPGATLLALQRRLADAAASKTAFGFEHSALMGIGPRIAKHTITDIWMSPWPSYEDMELKN